MGALSETLDAGQLAYAAGLCNAQTGLAMALAMQLKSTKEIDLIEACKGPCDA